MADNRPDLTARWQANWPDCPPIGYELKQYYTSRWVRFHSLPGSKRDTAAEYDTLLHRHNIVLTELFDGEEVLVVTTAYTGSGELFDALAHLEPVPLNIGAGVWMILTDDEREDNGEDVISYVHLLVRRWRCRSGVLDLLLRAVADDVLTEVLITDPGMGRIYRPYDGGADRILPSPADRNLRSTAHAEWAVEASHGFMTSAVVL
ncbi:DUF3885 domain-containing protein [Nonomuraea endophytica]|uniref:DUF3885 domain-containing protein n=1 Tax=Nonomuraea endophytica TaxID=714136 RepID=UPI0037CA61C5